MNIFIADNLKFLRYRNGYTLENIAEIISVSRQTVSKWETGDSVPDLLNCVKLANLYKVSIDELVNKSLKLVASNDFCEDNGCICGVVDISNDCNIQLPEIVMNLFDIKPNDKLLLLADKKQGMAFVKCSRF